jgi:hypothetical protein
MHYFGSKQELFRRVIDAAPLPEISAAPGQAAEQILASLASRLASEPVASLTLLRSMLTNPEAASAAGAAIARYEAQIAQAIPADDADLRAAIISAITLGLTVSRHLVKSDELADADPAQVIRLLRPCMLSLAASPDHAGPSGEGAGYSVLRRLAGAGMAEVRRHPARMAGLGRRRENHGPFGKNKDLLPERTVVLVPGPTRNAWLDDALQPG